jgi:hypothetical protein
MYASRMLGHTMRDANLPEKQARIVLLIAKSLNSG